MKKIFFILLLFAAFALALPPAEPIVTTIKLPEPDLNGKISLEQTIENRRSVRQFTAEPLTIEQIGQLCWSAQGITEPNKGLRAAPSAGALYPMQLLMVLSDGLYLYSPQTHTLEKQIEGDIRPSLRTAGFGQKVLQDSPCIFIIAGAVKQIEAKYRGNGEKFAYLEAGHIAQNIHLQSVALGLGSVPVGGFAPKSVAGICKISGNLEILYIVCVGNPVDRPVLAPAVASAAVPSLPVRSAENIRSKRVVIFVPEKYFNDRDYFGVENALKLVGISPVIASSVKGDIKGIERNTITAGLLTGEIKVDDYDAFVFIGGPTGRMRDYFDDAGVLNLIRAANQQKRILAAIGAAPVIFANADIVRGKKLASAAQRNRIIAAGGQWKNTTLQIDGNIITSSGFDAAGVDTAQRFGAAIVDMLRTQVK